MKKLFLLAMGILCGRVLAQEWYVFQPENQHQQPSLIGLEDWNAEPAGTYGRITRRDDLLFYNGNEIKLWGLNNTYSACAPDKETAEKRAAFYRKFGMNAMRLHKYADGKSWAGIQSEESFVKLEPEKLDRMDYYIHVLKENGIFTKLSPTFGVKFGPADLEKVPFHAEIGSMKKDRIKAGHGWVNLAPEIQDLQIAQTVGLLNHTNPYTGMRYAVDPAIFCVEIYNEDSVLFSRTNGQLQRSPTMRKRHGKGFADWLLQKYQTEEAWRAAWGAEAVIDNPAEIPNSHLRHLVGVEHVRGDFPAESLAAGTVVPWGQPWFYDAAMKKDSEQAFLETRMLDTMQYLIGLQNEFYARYVKEIRATGFKGEIIGSNWQAGSNVGHLLNLHSDYLVGIIDRHNYFGGGGGASKGRPFKEGSMLATPGMGSLSAGFQQVDDRPFMLSEWIHVQPNEWYAEGPAILGAYGWGLQGWDVSYIFENRDNGEFSEKIFRDLWDVSNPAVLAVYAGVSRQVRRMDVKEAPETKTLNVHLPSLMRNQGGFVGMTEQNWDEKSFTTDKVPAAALAATRVAVAFTSENKATPAFDLKPYLDGKTVVSSTGQLRWTPAAEGEKNGGYFVMNTPGTKAFVGFAPGGKTFELGDGYRITPEKGFAVIYLSAKGPKENLKTASEIVMVCMARTRNTGMTLNEQGNKILNPGTAPLQMEPVRAELQLPFAGSLDLLDHDGRVVTEIRAFEGGLRIDGAGDQTPFYLIRK